MRKGYLTSAHDSSRCSSVFWFWPWIIAERNFNTNIPLCESCVDPMSGQCSRAPVHKLSLYKDVVQIELWSVCMRMYFVVYLQHNVECCALYISARAEKLKRSIAKSPVGHVKCVKIVSVD